MVFAMIGHAKDIQVKFFEEKKINTLEVKVNEFIQLLASTNAFIIDLKYESEKEEYGKHFTAMVIFKEQKN